MCGCSSFLFAVAASVAWLWDSGAMQVTRPAELSAGTLSCTLGRTRAHDVPCDHVRYSTAGLPLRFKVHYAMESMEVCG